MTIQVWQLIITFISGSVVAAVISGLFNIFNKKTDYTDSYFKIVVEKRVNAYMELQQLVMFLKTATIDPIDRKAYHVLLQSSESSHLVKETLFKLAQNDIWFSNDISRSMIELSRIIFSLPSDELINSVAKENYKEIANLRENIERACLRDIASLHQVPKFLKSKAVDSGFVNVNLKTWHKQA